MKVGVEKTAVAFPDIPVIVPVAPDTAPAAVI
jgi:hypothetical protein